MAKGKKGKEKASTTEHPLPEVAHAHAPSDRGPPGSALTHDGSRVEDADGQVGRLGAIAEEAGGDDWGASGGATWGDETPSHHQKAASARGPSRGHRIRGSSVGSGWGDHDGHHSAHTQKDTGGGSRHGGNWASDDWRNAEDGEGLGASEGWADNGGGENDDRWAQDEEWEGQGHGDEAWPTNDDNNWEGGANQDWTHDVHQDHDWRTAEASSSYWARAEHTPNPPPSSAPPSAPMQGTSWRTWGQEAQRLRKVTWPTPNLAAAAPPASTGRTSLSPQQQSQILRALLNQPTLSIHRGAAPHHNSVHGHAATAPAHAIPGWGESSRQIDNSKRHSAPLHHRHDSRKIKKDVQDKERRHYSHIGHSALDDGGRGGSGWGDENGNNWGEGGEDGWNEGAGARWGDEGADGWTDAGNEGWAETADGGWGDDGWERKTPEEYMSRVERQHNPSYSMPSKTMAHAKSKMTNAPWRRASAPTTMSDYVDLRFVESHGRALRPVDRAFFGTSRYARDRIHWMFPPDKDDRVASTLAWIQGVSYDLGGWGLHKFLQSRERGAFFVNVDYHPPNMPNKPVFDWLIFDQLQPTMDRILQESVAFYDPAVQTIVFVLLPSKSGNSVAIWRRKVKVPNNVRLAYQKQIKQAMGALRKDYVVHVDQVTQHKLQPQPSEKKPRTKRKWWKILG